ncbi:MAG: hypothetical protein AAGU19_08055 [Prolixibacteraceae bacterium]
MKLKILEALKNKYKTLGFGDKAFEGVANYLATTVADEANIETAIAGVEPLLKSFQGDIDKRVNEAVEKAKKEKTPEAEKKPAEAKKEETPTEQVPEWAKALIESNKKLSDELAGIKGEKVADTRKSKLDTALAKAPEVYKARIQKNFGRMSFQDDAEYEEWLTEITTEAETLATEATQKGSVFSAPKGGGKGTPDAKPSPEVQARIDARQAQPVASPIMGLPVTPTK